MSVLAEPLGALSGSTGIDLRAYRSEHVEERIARALDREGVAGVVELARLLRSDPAARTRFRRSVAVSVSGLFRDPAQFELLERTLLPPLLADGRRLTVWSAGCADGSELVSAALVLDRLGALGRSTLLGSDLLEENLALARRGEYGDVSVPAPIQARTRWERRDLVRDGPPTGKWRLVLCRNVAIYLAPEARQALHETLAVALARRGILLLGRSERLARPSQLGLEPVAPHAYQKVA